MRQAQEQAQAGGMAGMVADHLTALEAMRPADEEPELRGLRDRAALLEAAVGQAGQTVHTLEAQLAEHETRAAAALARGEVVDGWQDRLRSQLEAVRAEHRVKVAALGSVRQELQALAVRLSTDRLAACEAARAAAAAALERALQAALEANAHLVAIAGEADRLLRGAPLPHPYAPLTFAAVTRVGARRCLYDLWRAEVSASGVTLGANTREPASFPAVCPPHPLAAAAAAAGLRNAAMNEAAYLSPKFAGPPEIKITTPEIREARPTSQAVGRPFQVPNPLRRAR